VVRVTGNFTSQSPLHPAAKALLNDAFDQGWADPRKIGDDSSRTAILRQEAIESLATNLKVLPSEIEIIGEPRLGQHLSISGLLNPGRKLIHSKVDRKSVFAVGEAHAKNGGSVEVLEVNSEGQIQPSFKAENEMVLAVQGANIETGIKQNINALVDAIAPTYVALDYSASPMLDLPNHWDSAIFDATTWQGPAGLGVLAIRNANAWKNPLPNLGIRRTPESSSLPLLIASAVALDTWLETEKVEASRISQLNAKIRNELTTAQIGIQFAGQLENTLAHTIAINVAGCVGEDLVRQLNELRFVLDSGSACTADQMQPSHVLAALGMESSGNLRITLHHGVTDLEVSQLIAAIISVVQQSR
jgi:cysteine desulfurase